MADDTPATGPYTRGEKLAGIFGALLFLALAAVALDLATGGKLFKPRGGCGCKDQEVVSDDSGS